MNKEEQVEQSIKSIISRVTGLPVEELDGDVNIRDELLVDSLKQMEIIVRIERELKIPLDEGRLICLETLGEFFDLVHAQM